jgi:hypothetical protein
VFSEHLRVFSERLGVLSERLGVLSERLGVFSEPLRVFSERRHVINGRFRGAGNASRRRQDGGEKGRGGRRIGHPPSGAIAPYTARVRACANSVLGVESRASAEVPRRRASPHTTPAVTPPRSARPARSMPRSRLLRRTSAPKA